MLLQDHRPGFEHGPRMRGDVMDKVAAKLKLTEEQLHTRLESGKTLAQVAQAQGVSRADLIATLTAALKAEGVPSGRFWTCWNPKRPLMQRCPWVTEVIRR